jgi:hypothetical protein
LHPGSPDVHFFAAGLGSPGAEASVKMTRTARFLALAAATAMFCFSLWSWSRSGDWVAIVFALGSAAYGIFFFTTSPDEKQ